MMISVCRLELRLPENQSLKGKRMLVQSVVARVQNRFRVAAAEIEAQDRWQIAVFGLAYVSNTEQHARQVMEAVVDYIESSRLDAEVLDASIEVLSA
jgi:uncharacterized protein YlxP (DUF503 family)